MSDAFHIPREAAEWEPMHFGSAPDPDDRWTAVSTAGKDAEAEFSALYPGSDAARDLPAPRDPPGQAPPDIAARQQEAYQEGLARGEADGFAAGLEKAAEVVENLHKLLTAAERVWPTLCRTYEHQIIALVGRVAEKVVCGQVALDGDVVRRTILKAFEQIPEPLAVTLEVNPEDYEYLEALKKPLMAEIRGLKQLSLQADPSVSRGGCRIETRSGAIDATLEARLEAVRQCLLDVAPRPQPDTAEALAAED